MGRDENAIEPGYYSDGIDPGAAERLVLRFPEGELLALPSEDGLIRLELELRGHPGNLASWRPSVRRTEGILVLADEASNGVVASVAKVRIPASFRDIEAHALSGSIELRDLGADLVAATDSGDIRVSGGASVEATSTGGSVEIESCAAVNAKLVSGSLRCRDIGGTISAESQSGDVSVEAAAGNVIVASGSGDIAVLKPGGRLRVTGGSGDVELEIVGRFAGGEVSTTSGDVSLALGGSDLELRAETLSGDLDAPGAEIPLTTGPRRCALRLGSGGRRLHVRSVSGDIEIER